MATVSTTTATVSADEGCVCSPGSTASLLHRTSGDERHRQLPRRTQVCDATGTGYGACVGSVTPSVETCGDGLDERLRSGPRTKGVSARRGRRLPAATDPRAPQVSATCQAGIQTCNDDGNGVRSLRGFRDAHHTRPRGDTLDNDCDAYRRTTAVCAPGSAAACYSGPPSTEDVGTCLSGTQTCNAAGTAYEACVGGGPPAIAEICGDGIDNDCDGVSDDGCVASRSRSRRAAEDPREPQASASAKPVSKACNATGTGYGACVGDVVPSAEICGDGLDNDCDGPADEVVSAIARGKTAMVTRPPGRPVRRVRRVSSSSCGAAPPAHLSPFRSAIAPATTLLFGCLRHVLPSRSVLRLGFTPTASDVGADDALDSDFDPRDLGVTRFHSGQQHSRRRLRDHHGAGIVTPSRFTLRYGRPGRNPSFSPDGSKLVLLFGELGERRSTWMNADGTGLRNTDQPSRQGHPPSIGRRTARRSWFSYLAR